MDKRELRGIGLAVCLWLTAMVAPLSGQQADRRHGGSGQENRASSLVLLSDTIQIDPETSLVKDTQLILVKSQCTACHSSKLILQSHFSREKWVERIRWMQRTQNLWDLGESEPAILDYLVKHYGPATQTFDGRREPLSGNKWYKANP